jgi:hypothetical protein
MIPPAAGLILLGDFFGRGTRQGSGVVAAVSTMATAPRKPCVQVGGLEAQVGLLACSASAAALLATSSVAGRAASACRRAASASRAALRSAMRASRARLVARTRKAGGSALYNYFLPNTRCFH